MNRCFVKTAKPQKSELFASVHRALVASGCFTVLLPAQMVLAQSAPASNSATLEEIVVTAQKRQENLQEVPIAVTAVSGDTLERVGITDTFDLKAVAPGLNFSTAVGGIGLPRIRGVGSTGTGPGVENPVATYIDGVYIGSGTGSLTSLADIEQVAVLKGPQGTLFGRNATGGLIQITTKRPSHEFSGDLTATVGNYDTVGGSLYLTGGLSDSLAASVAFKYEDRREGWGVNTRTGNDILTQESYTGRAKLLWEPGDNTTVTLTGDLSHTEAVSPAFRPLSRNVRGNFASGGQRDIDADIDPPLESQQYGGSLEIRHDFGSMELMSLTAYRDMELSVRFDPDGTTEDEWLGVTNANVNPLGTQHGFINGNDQYDTQFTQEIQLLSTGDGPFKWVIGAFYMDGEGKYDPSRSINASTGALNQYTDLTATQTLESLAGFAQGTYSFTDATNLTLGVRYTSDKREAYGIRQTYSRATGQPITPQPNYQGIQERYEDTFPKTTYRLSLDHRFSDDVMGYVSYNRGFRSASFVVQNIGTGTTTPPFTPTPTANKVLKPEIVDAYEMGLKTDLVDNRVRLNVAGYYYDQENTQVMQIISGIQNIYNAEGAEIYGADIDLTAVVSNNFTVNTGINYTHGRYTNFPNASIAIPRGSSPACPFGVAGPFAPAQQGGNCLVNGDASGKKLQNVPDWTANLGMTYDIPSAVGDFTLSANYYYNDGWAADPDNRVQQDAYDQLDGSIMWHSPGDTFSVSVWGKNLTDSFYFQQLGASNFNDNGVQAAPLTYGVTFGVHF